MQLTKDYSTSLIFKIGFLAALAGLLFGVDTGIISGALEFIQHDFQLTVVQEEMVVASLLIGAVLGTLISNPVSHYWGRDRALLFSAIIFFSGSILSALAPNYYLFTAIRLILGIAVGMASFSAPVYLSEVAPKQIRGTLIALYQLMITIGILLAGLIDTYFSYKGSWRGMFSTIAVPALIMLIGTLFLPRSPRWLMLKGKKEEALAVIKKIFTNSVEINKEIQELENNLKRTQEGWSVFRLGYFRKILGLGFVLQFIQIMTGMNTLMYYAPKIFSLIGFSTPPERILATVGLFSLNVIVTILSLFIIDRWGRRPLSLFGLAFMMFGMLCLGLGLNTEVYLPLRNPLAVGGMLSFIFGFAISLGPIVWIMCAEIFPLRSRDIGVMFTTATNWIANAILGGFFLSVMKWIGPSYTFWILAFICVLSMLYIYFFCPETKNVALEMIERNLLDGKPLRYLGEDLALSAPQAKPACKQA